MAAMQHCATMWWSPGLPLHRCSNEAAPAHVHEGRSCANSHELVVRAPVQKGFACLPLLFLAAEAAALEVDVAACAGNARSLLWESHILATRP